MSDHSINSINSNLQDADNSLGQQKSDVDDVTSALASTSVMGETDKPTPSAFPLQKRDSGTVSLPSLSSFEDLEDDDGEDMADYDDYDDDEFDDDDDEIIKGELVRNSPSPPPMPTIPGLEVPKGARPGRFLAELTVSADSLVNKRTPEKELGARWKDGSIPIAKLMKQKEHEEDKEESKEKAEPKGRGRRNSGRRRFRSKSPPPPTEGARDAAKQNEDSSDDDDALLYKVPPSRPVRQVSIGEFSASINPFPPQGIAPTGAFSSMAPSMTLPAMPERKRSVNMVQSTAPLLSPSPHPGESRFAPPGLRTSVPEIDLSSADNNAGPDAIPPNQPMRQTTRILYDTGIEPIAEDSTNEEEDHDDPLVEGTRGSDNDSPSLPQRRATIQDARAPVPPTVPVEEHCDADGNPADEMPNLPERQTTL